MTGRAEEIIAALALAPHPEGGFFREFFRSPASVDPGDGRPPRAALSAIYFLLRAGDVSRWHSVRSDEQWTFLAGDALELVVLERASFRAAVHRVGAGTHCEPVVVVPGGSWQAARPLGSHALVTCTVGPAFEFADFRLMADDGDASARLHRDAPELARFL